MHHCVGATIGERSLDLVALRKVALDKSRPRIDCAAMAFAQIVKDRDFVAFIQQLFRANTADVTRAAGDENSHGRGKCSVICFESKANRRDGSPSPPSRNLLLTALHFDVGRAVRRRLRDGFALLFLKSSNHLQHATMFATRGEDFQTLFLRAPFQNVDVHVADAPAFHLEPARLVEVDGVGADQRISIIVDNVFFICLGNSESGSYRKVRPIRRGTHHMLTGKTTTEGVVVSASSLAVRVSGSAHLWYATRAGDSRF